jgi:predicted nucleic acid-binding protein
VARIVLLDAGPLGLACGRPGTVVVDQCHAWLVALEAAGAEVVLPAIADYEVRREIYRLNASAKIRNLDVLRARFDYLEITAAALDQAATYWALVRRGGRPTAGPDDLDADAILAGMAATSGQPGDTVTLATTNLRHLGLFPGVDAQIWHQIK